MLPPRTRLRSARTRLTGLALVAALGAGGTVLWQAAPASADIAQQIRDTQARLDALDRQSEAAAERFDAGRIALSTAQDRAAVAQARVARADAAVAALQQQAGAFAAQAYIAGPGGQGLDILSGTSPEQVLGQLGTLDRISANQSGVLADLALARHRQAAAAGEARVALDRTRATLADLAAAKRTVEDSAVQTQQLLAQLQEKQRQIIAAAKAAAERKAAEARAAELAAQAQRAAAALAAFRAQQTAPERAPAPRPAPATHVAPTPAPVVHAAGGAAQTAVRVAMAQLGKSYVWGASGPDHFDCSGLTMYAYAAAGISLSHYTGAQWNEGRHVGRGELQPGDLVFFEKTLGHMGMYLGGGRFIHAPHTGDVVKISDLSGYYAAEYAGAVRPAG